MSTEQIFLIGFLLGSFFCWLVSRARISKIKTKLDMFEAMFEKADAKVKEYIKKFGAEL